MSVLSEKQTLPTSSWLPACLKAAARLSKASELERRNAAISVGERSIAYRKRQVAQRCTSLVACL